MKRPKTLDTFRTRAVRAVENTLASFERNVGGRRALVDALAINSANPVAKKFLDLLTDSRTAHLSLVDIFAASRTSPDELIRVFTEGSQVRATVEAIAVLSEGLPGTVKAALKNAQLPGPDGLGDRKLILAAGGIVHSEGGVQLNFQQQILAPIGAEGSFERLVGASGALSRGNPFELPAKEVIEE